MISRSITVMASSLVLLGAMVVPAYAQTSTSAGSAARSEKEQINPIQVKAPKSTVDNVCVQTAVDAREDATGVAFTAFATAETAALSARKTALHDAWGITTSKERRVAREKAWSDFRTASKSAHAALRSARDGAWKTFVAASKTCKVPVVETASAEGQGHLGL